MPLQISLTGEHIKKTFEFNGTKFFYEEGLGRDVQTIRAPFNKTRNGKSKFNVAGFTDAILEKYLVGWEDLQDTNGSPIPFTQETKTQVIKALPPTLRDALFSAIMGTLADEEEDDENAHP